MHPWTRPADRSRSGQSLVEMAFVLPIILLLALGLAEYAWMFYNISAMQFAAHEGARYGAVGRTNQEVSDKVKESMWGMSVTTIEISVVSSGGSVVTSTDRTAGSGNQITVVVRTAYNYLTPLAQMMGNRTQVTELRGTATAMIENGLAQ